jgi:hypothetical protein
MSATLFTSQMGLAYDRQLQASTEDVFQLDIRPTKARLVANNYKEADELELTCSFDEAGVDPRYLRSAEVLFWLWDDNAPAPMNAQGDGTLRFTGIVRDISREFSETSKIVTMRVLDSTTLFLEMKKFPAGHLPLWTDTLASAWQKICRWTGFIDFSLDPPGILSSICDPDSSAGTFDGVPRIPLKVWQDSSNPIDLNKSIGSTVPKRIAALSGWNDHTGVDSWTIWTNLCMTQGLITFIRGGECIVTTGTEFRTASDPPVLVYGANILDITERRDLGAGSASSVCLRSYDGSTGSTLEAFFPDKDSPLAQKIRKKKTILPNTAKKGRGATIGEEYELIDLQIPITDQATLNEVAKLIWMDKVRSELTGTLTTREMLTNTAAFGAIRDASGTVVAPGLGDFDLVGLAAGDNLQIQIEDAALDDVQSLGTVEERIAALMAKGYSDQMAQYISQNLASLTGPGALPSVFLVHSVETSLNIGTTTGDGSFEMKIEFLNQLDLGGAAALQTASPDAPQITGSVESINGDIVFDK